MKELEEARLKVLAILEKENESNSKNFWVEWVHEGTSPATTNIMKALNATVGILSKHCPVCLNLNGCRFAKNNMPENPLHPGCHCKIISIATPIAGYSAIAECDVTKFSDYVFHPIKNEGKKALFEAWGYDIMDSRWLQVEFIKQAQEKYAKGEYVLGKLNGFGQRISIEIVLPRKSGKSNVTFMSGWMVYPNGIIKMTTPYGG